MRPAGLMRATSTGLPSGSERVRVMIHATSNLTESGDPGHYVRADVDGGLEDKNGREPDMKETLAEAVHRRLYLGLQRLRGRPVGAFIKRLQEWEKLDRAAFNQLASTRLQN